jgi:hypothetical protein
MLKDERVTPTDECDSHLGKSSHPENVLQYSILWDSSNLNNQVSRWHPQPLRSCCSERFVNNNITSFIRRETHVYGPLGVPLCPTPRLSNASTLYSSPSRPPKCST